MGAWRGIHLCTDQNCFFEAGQLLVCVSQRFEFVSYGCSYGN
jgi:hypothetical protein